MWFILIEVEAKEVRQENQQKQSSSEAGELLRFLRWCKDRRYLREMLLFTKTGRKDIRRPAFDRDNWNKVIQRVNI